MIEYMHCTIIVKIYIALQQNIESRHLKGGKNSLVQGIYPLVSRPVHNERGIGDWPDDALQAVLRPGFCV